MFKGSLYLTDDINVAQSSLYGGGNCKVVALAEHFEHSGFIDQSVLLGSILLPSFNAISAELDGDLNTFYGLYYNHLASRESDKLLTCMIAAMIKGINVVFYVPKAEASNLSFVGVLLQYVYDNFGIMIGTQNNNFAYNEAFFPIIYNKLYIYGYMSVEDFLSVYPADTPINEVSVNKLITEMQLLQFKDMFEAQRYFMDYVRNIKLNNGVFLNNPITKG